MVSAYHPDGGGLTDGLWYERSRPRQRRLKWLRGGSALLLIFATQLGFAQAVGPADEIEDDYLFAEPVESRQFDVQLSIKTKNLFRGLVPSSNPTIAASAGFTWPSGFFVGAYGGVGLNDQNSFDDDGNVSFKGQYQETDLFMGIHKPDYSVILDYYYNFTEGISDVPKPGGFFDFDKQTARGLLDLMVQYRFGEEKQWQIESSTFLFGLRDVDTEMQGEPPATVRTDARYSQYFELQYSRSMTEHGLDKAKLRVGGATRWAGDFDDPNFYSSSAAIVNVAADYIKYFEVGEKSKIPLKLTLAWNPDSDNVYFVATVSLIQFSNIPL